ncbi:MAG: RNA 2',3'-cyclic phosphodiesterase [Synergistaceae bacterium]|nr:RNA 2',3'-cyclic phosphodiesterase [Synergistaceae bacterium]
MNNNNLVRAFIAVNITEPAGSELEKFLNTLRPMAKLKWVTRPQFHITLKFLGEQPMQIIEQVKAALKPIKFSPFNITLDYAGAFPNFNRPRVLWLSGRQGRSELINLANLINNNLNNIELNLNDKDEGREFKPHFTLARISRDVNAALPQNLLDALKNFNLKFSWQCSEFNLMRSKLTPQGAVYSKINL